MSKMSELIGNLRLSTQRGQIALEMLPYLAGTDLKGNMHHSEENTRKRQVTPAQETGKDGIHNHLEESRQYSSGNHASHPVPAQLPSNAGTDHSGNSMGA